MLSGTSGDLPVPADIAEINSPPLENIQITDDPRVQQRPTVAVNPLDPNHVVIAFNDAEHQRQVDAELGDAVGIAVSLDGGESWQLETVPLPGGLRRLRLSPQSRI